MPSNRARAAAGSVPPAAASASLSGTLTANVTASTARYSTSPATVHGSAGRPGCSTAAAAADTTAPPKQIPNQPLRTATLICCIASTNVRSPPRANPGTTAWAKATNSPATSPFVITATTSAAVPQLVTVLPPPIGPATARSPHPGAGTGHRRTAPSHVRSSNLTGVDALAGLLDGPRAQGAFLIKAVLRPPWSLRVADEAPLAVFTLLAGTAWLVHPGVGEPVRLGAGDIVVTRGADHYTVADRPDRAPTLFVGPGGDCRDAAGAHLADAMRLGVRTWGNDPAGPVVLLSGAYALTGEVGARLLRALPPVLVLGGADGEAAPGSLTALLGTELARDEPGQEAVLDRLLDLLLITALRAWFARPEAAPPTWCAARADPVVGRALALLHHNPAHPWTVAALAAAVGVSRATLARRFTELVGEPPMAFLTGWRLALAADLLRDPEQTLGAVARQVGYGSPFALSTAFKRARGVSPRDHRAATG